MHACIRACVRACLSACLYLCARCPVNGTKIIQFVPEKWLHSLHWDGRLHVSPYLTVLTHGQLYSLSIDHEQPHYHIGKPRFHIDRPPAAKLPHRYITDWHIDIPGSAASPHRQTQTSHIAISIYHIPTSTDHGRPHYYIRRPRSATLPHR